MPVRSNTVYVDVFEEARLSTTRTPAAAKGEIARIKLTSDKTRAKKGEDLHFHAVCYDAQDRPIRRGGIPLYGFIDGKATSAQGFSYGIVTETNAAGIGIFTITFLTPGRYPVYVATA